MPEIVYPMSLDYVNHWGPWEVVREIATNALDVDPNFSIGMNEDGALVVRSQGGDLAIRHLLFGVSEKANEDAIGEFGEGLKLALLVLTRMGLQAHIYSGGRHLWNELCELEGEQVFKVVWESFKDTGTTVVGIPHWPYEAYKERFLRPGDPRIIHTDQFGRHILEEESPSIYVKRVWVQGAKSYGALYVFGYNLVDVEMNRDRGVVDAWRANQEIGRIWTSVTDDELLERFWRAVKDGQGEKDCSMHNMPIKGQAPMRRALRAVYGKDAVVRTEDSVAREAAYRGAEVVNRHELGSAGLADLAADLLGTDAQHVAAMEGKEKIYMPDKKLGERELTNLKVLRRLSKRVGAQGKVLAYILPPDVNGECSGDDIRISIGRLEIVRDAVQTWLHEVAHAEYGTPDATAEHVAAVSRLAADVIVGYATR